MLEKDIENMISEHPDDFFPGEGFSLIGQQVTIKGKRIDILFQDKYQRQIIVEVKRGVLSREAAGQILEYYGLLKDEDEEKTYELILCANVIPHERIAFLERTGIDCNEISAQRIRELAAKYNYHFLDDQSQTSPSTNPILKNWSLPPTDNSEDISVWIFQANPNYYDVMNALDDKEIGNQIHWLVNQNTKRIHKGHLGLLWMSGPDSGIYALMRVETEPSMMEEYPSEKKYWFTDKEDKLALRVRLSILRRFVNKPILRKSLLQIPELSTLSILRQSQGTNFSVSNSEWMVINQLM